MIVQYIQHHQADIHFHHSIKFSQHRTDNNESQTHSSTCRVMPYKTAIPATFSPCGMHPSMYKYYNCIYTHTHTHMHTHTHTHARTDARTHITITVCSWAEERCNNSHTLSPFQKINPHHVKHHNPPTPQNAPLLPPRKKERTFCRQSAFSIPSSFDFKPRPQPTPLSQIHRQLKRIIWRRW